MSPELSCLTALTNARAMFFQDIVKHYRAHTAEPPEVVAADVDLIMSDSSYQIAQFYFVVEERGLADQEKIKSYLDCHNKRMSNLAKPENKGICDLIGVTQDRMKWAKFEDDQITKVLMDITLVRSKPRLRLDQSALSRLLSRVLAPETCRKSIVALGNGGLLNRFPRRGEVAVISTGLLEDYFRKHLTHIVQVLKQEC